MSEFEFEVRIKGRNACPVREPQMTDKQWATFKDLIEPSYQVYLPHSCGSWEITNTENKEKAIQDLEQFITEAQAALKELKDEG
jgi:hypothetical protein